MLIALCLYKYFPYGGLQRDFLAIAKTLREQGHQIRIYTREWEGDRPNIANDLILVPTKALTNHGKDREFNKWVLSHIKQHPVDRVVGFNKMPGLDVYYGADVCYAEKIRQEKKGWLYRFTSRCRHYLEFEKSVLEKDATTKILIISKKQKTDFQKHYQTEDSRFILLPPGISRDRRYQNISKDARNKLKDLVPISSDDYVLLQIGSDFQRKGVDRSILALASLPDELRKKTHLIVLGKSNATPYIQLAKKLEISEKVHFLGGSNQVPSFIGSADILLHPARSENTGTVILEALVGGLPEIVTSECGYAFYVEKAKTGIVLSTPFDQREFNQKLRKALNRKILDEFKRNACIFADSEDLYSLADYAAKAIVNK